MQVQMTVLVVAEVPDDTDMEGLHIEGMDELTLINTNNGDEDVDGQILSWTTAKATEYKPPKGE